MVSRRLAALMAAALLVASGLIVVLARRDLTLGRAYRDLRARAALPARGAVVPTFRTATLAGDSLTVGELAVWSSMNPPNS